MSESGPTAYRVLLGRELKALREQAKLDREAVAAHIGWHLSKVSRLETGQITLKATEVDQLLDLFKADESVSAQVRDVGQHARKRGSYGKVPDWSRQFLGLEQDASELSIYQGEVIPGLFQTEAYARALISTSVTVAPADEEKVVAARIRRQTLLAQENAPKVHVVLGEAALLRQVGGQKVIIDQLARLIELAKLPHVTIQILPFSAGEHAALGVGFTLLSLDIGNEPTTWVHVEALTKSDCLPDPGHVRVYRLTFDRLAINALGERESLTRLKRAKDALD
jgi:transcriptional regulator with XRE-family HTH domain